MNTNPHVKSAIAAVAAEPAYSPHPGQSIKERMARKTQAFAGVWDRSPRTFLRATVAAIAVGVFGLFLFSWYVNPWGNFGPTGYHVLLDARRAKADYIDALPPEQRPQALVLGSSNFMRYRPDVIEQHLGMPAFNFSVAWGKSEDFLCITLHLLRDLNHRPKLLIIGTDTWTFRPPMYEHPIFPGTRRRLLNTPQLVRHHPDVDPVSLYWSKFIDTFSEQQLSFSWRLWRSNIVPRSTRPPLQHSDHLNTDGTRIYYGDTLGNRGNIFQATENGQYPITQMLREIADGNRIEEIRDFLNIYDFDRLWEPRVEYARKLLTACSQNGIQVVFVLNPVHPIFDQLLNERTHHLSNVEELRSLLATFERDYPGVLGTVDASHTSKFGGDPDGFYDPIHPATRNCDLIIEQVARHIRSR